MRTVFKRIGTGCDSDDGHGHGTKPLSSLYKKGRFSLTSLNNDEKCICHNDGHMLWDCEFLGLEISE
jgi:hypothetical protein